MEQSSFWTAQRVLVTGGTGFLGSALVRALKRKAPRALNAVGSRNYDLVDRAQARQLIRDTDPTMIIHLAAKVGGIEANRRAPGEFFYENLMMGANTVEEARLAGVQKFVAIGTVCCYPKFTPVPFSETSLWDGYPEETNAPYGLAKKMLLVQLDAYRKQYGFNGIFLLPVNLYGPGDNFDATSSHVIPALIRKCVEACDHGAESIEVWGTGRASREFLFVDDAAEAIVCAAEHYESSEPLNIGSGEEILISELTAIIARLTGYRGAIRWDTTKPDGQPRRSLDITRLRTLLGFQATVRIEDGLQSVIDWYRAQLNLKTS